MAKSYRNMAETNSGHRREVIEFTKMHGLGNDYIYIDCMESTPGRLPDLAREMSDRHFGVGGDGIVLICPPTLAGAHFRMRMFNSDGSEARMCGNASRCIAAWLHSHHITDLNPINLETLSGIKVLTLNKEGDRVLSVTVDMGAPMLDAAAVPVQSETPRMIEAEVPVSQNESVTLTAVSMGNPHGIVFVDSIGEVDFDRLGPVLEHHPIWPDRANIEFAEMLAPDHIRVRVWERGTGETLACGTGACATAVAAMLTGRAAGDITVSLHGGDLRIFWDGTPDGHVYMTGPATEVFTGTYMRQNP